MKAPTKIDRAWARRSLSEAQEYFAELRAVEGDRRARALLASSDCCERCRRALETLRLAGEAWPPFVIADWSYFRAIGWHSLPDSQKQTRAA